MTNTHTHTHTHTHTFSHLLRCHYLLGQCFSQICLHFGLCNNLFLAAVFHLKFSYLVVVQSLSHVWLFATPWTAQASLSMGFSGQESWSGLPFPPPLVTQKRSIITFQYLKSRSIQNMDSALVMTIPSYLKQPVCLQLLCSFGYHIYLSLSCLLFNNLCLISHNLNENILTFVRNRKF